MHASCGDDDLLKGSLSILGHFAVKLKGGALVIGPVQHQLGCGVVLTHSFGYGITLGLKQQALKDDVELGDGRPSARVSERVAEPFAVTGMGRGGCGHQQRTGRLVGTVTGDVHILDGRFPAVNNLLLALRKPRVFPRWSFEMQKLHLKCRLQAGLQLDAAERLDA